MLQTHTHELKHEDELCRRPVRRCLRSLSAMPLPALVVLDAANVLGAFDGVDVAAVTDVLAACSDIGMVEDRCLEKDGILTQRIESLRLMEERVSKGEVAYSSVLRERRGLECLRAVILMLDEDDLCDKYKLRMDLVRGFRMNERCRAMTEVWDYARDEMRDLYEICIMEDLDEFEEGSEKWNQVKDEVAGLPQGFVRNW